MTVSAPTWQSLQSSADRARQGADHERAIELYTQALAHGDIPWQALCAMLLARADSYQMLGNTAGMDADLSALADQAAQRGDDAVQSEALSKLSNELRYVGELDRALLTAEQALGAAERSGQVGLKVKALCSLSMSHIYRLEWEASELTLNQAQAITNPADAVQQMELCSAIYGLNWRKGSLAAARTAAEQGLRLARAAGDRYKEGRFFNNLYIVEPDPAARGAYLDQALQAFKAVGARLYQNMILINTCPWWVQIGLYDHAVDPARQTILAGREMGQESDMLYGLQNLSNALAELGIFPEAVSSAQEALSIAKRLNDNTMEFVISTMLATIALYQGDPGMAWKWLAQIDKLAEKLSTGGQVNLLSLQAITARLQGDRAAAARLVQQTLERITPDQFGNSDSPVQQSAWWCYRALMEPLGAAPSDTQTDIPEEAWQALDLGCQALLVPIEHCSDAGLARGYLHRDRYNRLLVREWLRYAPKHGVDADGLVAFAASVQRPGRLDDVFRRLLGVGVRLNIQRDPALLPGQIVDDVAELIGAERIALHLLAPDGTRRTVKTRLPAPPFHGLSGKIEPLPDETAFLVEIEPWLEEASSTRQGFVRLLNPDGALTEQRSVLAAPLIYQNRLVGIIYCDLIGCFGRFTRDDLDLLSVLANQSAVAVENADWSATLEKKVAERTAELQQRMSELTIINEIQQGLVSRLDYQSILDLVGDRIDQIFSSDCTAITLYDRQNQTLCDAFLLAEGIHETEFTPQPLGRGLTSRVIESRQPLVISNIQEGLKLGSIITIVGNKEDKTQIESSMFVPWITGGEVSGVITVQRMETNAFTENDQRLLSTLVASMSAALENARLFAETQRLFTAEQERVAELAILNSVGEAMAKTMDVKTVARIVGDKVRDIFKSAIVSISLLDPHTNLIINQYEYDRGEGGYVDYIEPFPLGAGLTSKVITLQQPLLLGTTEEQAANGAFISKEALEIGSGVTAESWLGVPILSGDRVLGIVILADYQQHAYNENHVRLLQTLSANMGVAIENARLFQAEQERVAELQIINSIQQGLAAELDFQAIVNLVGDKLSEVLHTGNLGIRWIDTNSNSVHFLYEREHGLPLAIPSILIEPGLYWEQMMKTRQPFVANTAAEMEHHGIFLVPGTDICKSMVDIPIIYSDRFIGVIHDENFEREYAYGESELRLLTTIAGSLGSALENARLFAETQRLFKAEQERVAELAILNSVGEAMAKTMDVKTVARIVGDKVRDIFKSAIVSISLLDTHTNLIHILYEYDRGEGGYVDYIEPFPLGAGLTTKVITTRQPLLLGTHEEQKAEGAYIAPEQLELGSGNIAQSWLGVPILSGERVLGIVDLADYEKNAFNENHVHLLQTLSANMGVAIENARLFQAEQERVAELQIINSIQQGLAAELDFQAIINLVGDKLREVLHTGDLGISWYEQAAGLVHNLYDYEHGVRLVSQPPAPPRPGGPFSRMLKNRQPVVFNTVEEGDSLSPTIPGTDSSKSGAFIPVISGDRVLGSIRVESFEREFAYGESELRLLTTIAASLGTALENARLFAETQRLLQESQQRMDQLTMLSEVGRTLSSTLQVDDLLQRIYEQISRVMYAENMYIALYHPSTDEVEYVFSRNVDEVQPGERSSAKIGIVGAMLRTRQPVFIRGNGEEIERELGVDLVGIPAAAWLGVPLLLGERALGVIAVQHYTDPNAYDNTHLMLLQAIAGQAAVALENASLYVEADRRAGQMATLAEAGREITASHDLPAIMENITRRAHEVCKARSTVLRLLGEDGQTYHTSVALGEYAEQFKSDVITPGHGITGSIVVSGVPEIIADPRLDPRMAHVPGTPDEEEQPETIMIAPLVVRGRSVGVLTLYRYMSDGYFTPVDLDFLSGLARQAAIAIENLRLLEEAQEAQRRMADIINFLPDAALVIDRDGRVIAWNHAMEEMTGKKAEELLGKGDHEYALPFYGERRPILIDLVLLPDEEMETRYAHIHREGAILTGETFVPALNGRPAYLYANASALRNARGEVVGAIETIRDISDRKRSEEELRQAQTDAEAARQLAEAATQAKSSFLATMSHEIRTPMNAIIGMSGLLLNTPLDAQQSEFAEIIRVSGDALLTIINDILDFSKIEAGKLDLEYVAFDLRDNLESAIDLLATRAAEKKLDLAVEISPGVPQAIVGDATRLRQILLNLLNNAVKFTEHGEVVLSVNLQEPDAAVPAGPAGELALHFSVRDTGIGIPSDRLDRLFQSFSQVDASTSRKYGGTGLGLAISKRLAEMMGGVMWVESTAGVGSTFHFTIRTAPAPVTVSPRLQFSELQPNLAGRRLLVVDDNPTNRRIISLQARDWGMLPRETGSPAEALDWLRRGDPFDLAILDFHMPEMDGLALARAIRQVGGAASLPLVLLSSLGGRETGSQALEGMDWAARLTKPVKQSALYNILVSIFGQVEGKSNLQPAGAEVPASLVNAPQLTDAQRNPLKILLVEDMAFNRKLALHLLKQMGYTADVAVNGLEAIQSVERQEYDVVLMDVQMPEMDGLEATRQICTRWTRDQRPRIIAMTANAMQGDLEICLAAGMDDYVAKPIRVQELAAALERSRQRRKT